MAMVGFLLFCLVSCQLVMTVVVARPFPDFEHAGAMPMSAADAPAALHVHSLLESRFAGSPLSSHHHQHSPFDKAFAGGKIILGGLAAAIFAAVFCYIRITRRKNAEPKS